METLISTRFKTIAIDYIKHRKTKMYNHANDLGLNPVAMKLLEQRYLEKDDDDKIVETPTEMMLRIATAVASAEKNTDLKLKWKDEFFHVLSNLEFLPNSPCLASAGSKRKGTWLACFAYNIPDSLTDMFDVYKLIANTFKMGGGVGISIADVREEGAYIASTKGKSSGPIKLVLYAIDAITEGIKQGSFRRGALMSIINDTHPDLEQFIDAKADPTVLTNMNMSLIVCNKFMNAVKKDGEIDLISPATGKLVRKVPAKYIFEKIASRIHETGEPGLLFKDRINKDNPTPHLGELKLTNPCITGDTLIAVADGRNAVTIKQLVDEGKDVPVYCQDMNAAAKGKLKVVVRMGRSPRQTGIKDVYKVTLDDGSTITATPNHKFMLRTGEWCELKDLRYGVSLMPFNSRIDNGYVTINSNRHYWKRQFRLIWEFVNGKQQPEGYHIHHVDFNKLKVASIDYAGKENVYNITVNEDHNYFVITESLPDQSGTGVCLKNCAESTLLDGEACDLGSINLVRHITPDKKIDWEKLAKTISIGIRFLDNILEKSPYPDSKVKATVLKTRKVGLGLMGFADTLIMLNIKYSSNEAVKFADKVLSFMRKIAEQESAKLGKEKGFYEAYKDGCPKRRNAIVLTIAPTGTLSLLAGVSSGIEPNFEKVSRRTFYPENEDMIIEHPLKDHPCFETTYEIPGEQHLRILATVQKHVDNAVSKTLNLPENTTIDDIKELIIKAHDMGVKGLTIFRKNCKRKALIKCEGDKCSL